MTRLEQLNAKALEVTGGDRYLLSMAVAKRVQQLQNGARPLIDADTKKEKLTNIAIEEIASGLIDIEYRP